LSTLANANKKADRNRGEDKDELGSPWTALRPLKPSFFRKRIEKGIDRKEKARTEGLEAMGGNEIKADD